MNRTQILFLSGVIFFVGVVNAYILYTGFDMFSKRSFYGSSPSPSLSVASLPGGRFIIVAKGAG